MSGLASANSDRVHTHLESTQFSYGVHFMWLPRERLLHCIIFANGFAPRFGFVVSHLTPSNERDTLISQNQTQWPIFGTCPREREQKITIYTKIMKPKVLKMMLFALQSLSHSSSVLFLLFFVVRVTVCCVRDA